MNDEYVSNGKNPNILYDETSKVSGTSYWGFIPRSYGEAVEKAIEKFEKNKTQEKILLQLKEILITYHKDLGIYSPKVGEHIALLDNGSILTGQQPVIFGGPGLIANKIATVISMMEMFKKKGLNLAPVFFVGDYDGLQKELARQYFPNPISQNAHIIDSEDHLPEESSIAAHAAKLPPVEWLYDQIKKLDDNFRGFKKQVKGPSKLVLQERYAHVKTILKTSFKSSKTLSDWSVRIWGLIANVVNDYGIIFLPTSLPEIRELVAENFYNFIEKRRIYTNTFHDTMNNLIAEGYKPTLPHRHEDYAPFTLECGVDSNRITTSLTFKEDKIFAEGICPECNVKHSYEVTTKEHIKKIATKIGPRVDTSQAIFQELMNIRVRISGPGEIAYYAFAAPAIKAIGFNLPIFVKYTRAFYNSPWIEKLGKILDTRKQASIHTDELFKLLKDRMSGKKEGDVEMIQNAELDMEKFILNKYNALLKGKQSIDIDKYLGWQYGRFTKHKFAQEVSWVWFDMAIQTGINDYIPTYSRIYLEDSLIGGMYYINSMV